MPPVNDPASTTAGAASTFAKGLQVLRCFEGRREALSMAEVARLAGLDRATARRLCLALIDAGFLVARGRGLHLTARVLAVGAGYLAAHDVGRVVQPALNRAAEELGGDIALAVRDGGRAIYVACSATAGARVSQGFTAGSTLPLLPTAVGRMLLAGDTDTALDALLATPEATLRHTEATQTDPALLRRAVEAARRQGFAQADGDFETGVAGLAVPCGSLGGVEAVLGTSAPVNTFAATAERDRALAVLRRTAMALGLGRNEARVADRNR